MTPRRTFNREYKLEVLELARSRGADTHLGASFGTRRAAGVSGNGSPERHRGGVAAAEA